ncbi:hypothetical protein [Actinophytocola sp.]|uniref:hypothetical protein n=1 Tax=Actinophytocola sp. TaxID=1872138 RepID=UPI002ED60020
MTWLHRGYPPALAHRGFVTALIAPKTDEAARTAPHDRVTGWRAGCSCGWQGPTVVDRERCPSPTGAVPREAEEDILAPEWSRHVHTEVPELALYYAAGEATAATDRVEDAVRTARWAGVTWDRIAAATGLTRSAAHSRWRRLPDRSAPTTPPSAPWRPGLSHPRLRELVDGGQVPPATMATDEATMVARHVKAALMHLVNAEEIAERAGVDLIASPLGSGPAYDLAALWGAAYDTCAELDSWAIATARRNGARDAYDGTSRWCHKPGGRLPFPQRHDH